MNRFKLLTNLKNILKNNLVISNIGLPSQELYSINDCSNYFYMMGSMGLSSSIGLGLALSLNKNVISVLLHCHQSWGQIYKYKSW